MSRTLKGRLAEFSQRASLDDLNEAARVTHVTPATVLGWLNDASPPKGETLVRLQHYLQLKGLPLAELEQLPRPAFTLGYYLTLEVFDVATAQERLGYDSTGSFYRALRGSELDGARLEKLNQLLETFRPECEAALRRLDIRPFDDPVSATPAPSVAAPSFAFIVEHAAGAILTAASLAESILLSDDVKSADVRRLVGAQRLNELIERLTEIVDGQ